VRIHHQQPAQWNATRCWAQQQPGVVWTGKHRLLLPESIPYLGENHPSFHSACDAL
jgi:hypothetical protein